MLLPAPAQVRAAPFTIPLVPSGLYTQLTLDNNGTAGGVNNEERVIGFLIGAQTIAEIAFRVATVSTDAGATMRIGIRVDASGTPGAPAVENTQLVTGVNGWKAVAMNYAHPGGILWVSCTPQGQPASLASFQTAASAGYPWVGAAALSTLGWATGHGPAVGTQTGVSGALPATFVNVRTTNLNPWCLAAKAA